MRHLLVEMKTAVEQARQQNRSDLDAATLGRLQARYDQLVRRALRRNPRAAAKPPQRGRPRASPARNLAERLRDHKESVLRFVRDWRVPFDNNLAERDLRMMKVKLKVAGCFRSLAGAQMFACIRGYLSIARKQGFRALDALRAILVGQPIALQFA